MNSILEFLTANPALTAILIPALIGMIGSTLESIGQRKGWTWLVAVAQRLEAATIDVPKLIRGSRKTAEEKAKKDDSDPKTPRSGGSSVGPVTTTFMAFAVIALVACSGAQKPPPPECTKEQLAKLELSYIAEASAACAGKTYDSCEALPAIRAKYRSLRDEWKECGQ